jgi:hypothetical protein
LGAGFRPAPKGIDANILSVGGMGMRRRVIIFSLGTVAGFLLLSGFMAVLTHVRGH